jgi:hypothetical protein
MIPEGIVGAVRNSRIKEGLRQRPATISTDTLGQGFRIVVGEPTPKCLLGSMKKVLSVYERNGAFNSGLVWYVLPP